MSDTKILKFLQSEFRITENRSFEFPASGLAKENWESEGHYSVIDRIETERFVYILWRFLKVFG